MNISIEKISNGFILTLNDKRIFCDVPEAVCGELAQWALAECENLKEELEVNLAAFEELLTGSLPSSERRRPKHVY